MLHFDVKKCHEQWYSMRRCGRAQAALRRFSVKLYGAAGATIREGVLMHLWGSSEAPAGADASPQGQQVARRSTRAAGRIRWLSSARHYAKRNAGS